MKKTLLLFAVLFTFISCNNDSDDETVVRDTVTVENTVIQLDTILNEITQYDTIMQTVNTTSTDTIIQKIVVNDTIRIITENQPTASVYPISITSIENYTYFLEIGFSNSSSEPLKNIEIGFSYVMSSKVVHDTICSVSSIPANSKVKCRILKPTTGGYLEYLYIKDATIDGEELFLSMYDYDIYDKSKGELIVNTGGVVPSSSSSSVNLSSETSSSSSVKSTVFYKANINTSNHYTHNNAELPFTLDSLYIDGYKKASNGNDTIGDDGCYRITYSAPYSILFDSIKTDTILKGRRLFASSSQYLLDSVYASSYASTKDIYANEVTFARKYPKYVTAHCYLKTGGFSKDTLIQVIYNMDNFYTTNFVYYYLYYDYYNREVKQSVATQFQYTSSYSKFTNGLYRKMLSKDEGDSILIYPSEVLQSNIN